MNENGNEKLQLPKGADVVLKEQERYIVQKAGKKGGKAYKSIREPLAYYLAHRRITRLQAKAGNKLFRLWQSSGCGERYAQMRFSDVSGAGDAEGRGVSAQGYINACKAIPNEFNRKITISVCCGGNFAGRAHLFDALKTGLDDLIKHFDLKEENFTEKK